MPAERTRYRNVHFHNASTGELLGGFYQKGSVIGMNMLDILKHVLLVVDGGFDISVRHRETGVDLTQSPQPVALGDYDIYSQGMNYTYMNLHRQITHCALGSIKLTDESWVARLLTYSMSSREDIFRTGVRERDRKCVVMSEVNDAVDFGIWDGYHAAHIFPLHCKNLWQQFGYSRWITDMDDTNGVSKINSPQNGLLMSSHLHKRFDQYLFSINPDVSILRLISQIPDMLIQNRIIIRLSHSSRTLGTSMEKYWTLFAVIPPIPIMFWISFFGGIFAKAS